MLYGLALQDRWPTLPANALSTPHPQIDLPPSGNQQLMVEPYIHVARSALPAPCPRPPPRRKWLLALAVVRTFWCACLHWHFWQLWTAAACFGSGTLAVMCSSLLQQHVTSCFLCRQSHAASLFGCNAKRDSCFFYRYFCL